MSSIMYEFDLLKSPIFFLHNGRNGISTHIGFFFSLILLAILISTAISSDFFRQQKPIISVQSDTTESFAGLVFDRKNLTLIAKIADFTGASIIDYSYFYFNMTFNTFDAATEKISHNKKFMKICEETDFLEADRSLNLSGKSFCPSQNEPLILKGSVTSPSGQYAIIQLNRCDRASAQFFNVTCKSQEEMDQFLLNKFLYIYYSDNNFDLSNLHAPTQRSLNAHLVYFYPKVKKTTQITVRKAQIYTDLGQYLFDYGVANKYQETYLMGDITTDFTYDTIHFHEFFLTSDRTTTKMTRCYQRLQDLLAILGGISSTYLLIAGFLISHYKHFLLIFEIFGESFSFPEPKTPKKVVKIEKDKQIKIKSSPNNHKSSNLDTVQPSTSQNRQILTTSGKDAEDNLAIPKEGKPHFPIPMANSKGKQLSFPETPTFPEQSSISIKREGKIININLTEMSQNVTSKQFSMKEEEIKRNIKSMSITESEDLDDFPKRRRNISQVTYCEFLKFQFKHVLGMKLSNKENLLHEITKRFTFEMGVVTILEKMREIEKIKGNLPNLVLRNFMEMCARNNLVEVLTRINPHSFGEFKVETQRKL